MIEALAKKLTVSIQKYHPNSDAEIIEYGLLNLLNFTFVIVGTLFIGSVFRRLTEALIVLSAFGILRGFSGGYHLRSITHCTWVSIVLLSVMAILSPYLIEDARLALDILSLTIMVLLAPQSHYISTDQPRLLKLFASSLIIVNFFIQSSSASLAYFAQAVLLVISKFSKRR